MFNQMYHIQKREKEEQRVVYCKNLLQKFLNTKDPSEKEIIKKNLQTKCSLFDNI